MERRARPTSPAAPRREAPSTGWPTSSTPPRPVLGRRTCCARFPGGSPPVARSPRWPTTADPSGGGSSRDRNCRKHDRSETGVGDACNLGDRVLDPPGRDEPRALETREAAQPVGDPLVVDATRRGPAIRIGEHPDVQRRSSGRCTPRRSLPRASPRTGAAGSAILSRSASSSAVLSSCCPSMMRSQLPSSPASIPRIAWARNVAGRLSLHRFRGSLTCESPETSANLVATDITTSEPRLTDATCGRSLLARPASGHPEEPLGDHVAKDVGGPAVDCGSLCEPVGVLDRAVPDGAALPALPRARPRRRDPRGRPRPG